LNLTFAFRVDASIKIGTGHVMRCLTLATALRDDGNQVYFICCNHDGNLIDYIESHDFETFMIVNSITDSWLGNSYHTDAELTIDSIRHITLDWLIADHYEIDVKWEKILRPYCDKLMVIDDLANRNHDCDILLDQNIVDNWMNRYQNIVPKQCICLLGLKYTMLQPLYEKSHKKVLYREGNIHRILVFFGGSDTDNLTGMALSALLSLDCSKIRIDIVLPINGTSNASIYEQVDGYENIHLHEKLPTLACLLEKADLAIGSGGTTNWERLCLGLPTLVITVAHNQIAIARKLHQEGLISWLGHVGDVVVSDIEDFLNPLIQFGLQREWSQRCYNSVDGLGVYRVCSVLNG